MASENKETKKLATEWLRRFILVGMFLLVVVILTIFEVSSWPSAPVTSRPEPIKEPIEPVDTQYWNPALPTWKLMVREQLSGLTPPSTDTAPNYTGVGVKVIPTPESICSTINMWVKVPPSFPFGSVVLPATFQGVSDNSQYFLAVSRHFVYFGMCGNCPGGGGMGSRTAISSGQWHMLTGMLDLESRSNPEWRVFVDSVLVGTGFGPSDLRTGQLQFLDVRAEYTPEEAQVLIRDITYYYDTCLSPSSLRALYERGLGDTDGPNAG